MRRLVYLDRAKRDIKRIIDFIAERAEDPEPSIRFGAALRKQCQTFARLQTVLGRPRPELGRELRSFPFRKYIIFIRYSENRVEIAAILRTSQDIAETFADWGD